MMEKFLILLPIGLLAVVQLLLKWQAATHAPVRSALVPYLFSLATSPWVWFAVALAGLAFVAWMVVLKRMPLGFAYPFISLTFPLVVIGGILLFGEQVNLPQLVGLGLIVIGVTMHAIYAHA